MGGIFSVALSVNLTLHETPRPLAGTVTLWSPDFPPANHAIKKLINQLINHLIASDCPFGVDEVIYPQEYTDVYGFYDLKVGWAAKLVVMV